MLKIYVDGVNDMPFPRGAEEPMEIGAFRYDAKRMGGAPTITASVNYSTCLDDEWEDLVYTELNGEKYFLKHTPTSSKNNEDSRYRHDLILVAERVVLDDAYFYDAVVGDPIENDKPVTNSTKFHFYGNIEDFVKRMNASLQHTNLQTVNENGEVVSGYHVILDDDVVNRDEKLISFDEAVFSQALQESYNTFGIPYYFNGKEIHVGFSTNIISDVLEYGVDGALLSASRNNANFKVVNKATGYGSSDNIPFYYPNNSPKGEIGAESSNPNLVVKIEDPEKYSNEVSIDESIEYMGHECNIETTEYRRESSLDWISYNVGDTLNKNLYLSGSEYTQEFRTKLNTQGKTTLLLRPQFDLLDFKLHRGDGEIVDFDKSLVKVRGKIQVFFVDDHGNTQLWWKKSPIISGEEYKVVVPRAGVYHVYFIYSLVQNIDSFDPYYTKNKFVASVSYNPNIDDISGWFLGDKAISLEDIGLSLTNQPSVGDTITQRLAKRVNTSDTLQPYVYRATGGKERFYYAINYPFPFVDGYELKYGEEIINGEVHNDIYKKDDGTYHQFTNEYKEGRPREHVFSVGDLKPTIKEMTNNISWQESSDDGETKTVFQRIDMFSEFAYNKGDNDETYIDPNGNTSFKHPYFFAKLRKLDFNLFEHASELGEMTFSMTSGHCGACNFKIGVDKEGQFNPVQVDENGDLIYDDNGYVRCGLEDWQGKEWPQDEQQDTVNHEVWIALKKEEDTYGILMPKAPKYENEDELIYDKNGIATNGVVVDSGHRPKACSSANDNDGDTFVILNINLPEEYIYFAEKKLEKKIIQYIWENNVEKFNFSVNFSRIFLEENSGEGEVATRLNENAKLTRVKYNGQEYSLFVSSYSYTMNEGDVLPEIRVELDDTLTISQNALQNAINEVKSDIASAINSIDVATIGSRYFVRKDVDDVVEGAIEFKRGLLFGENSDIVVDEDGQAKLTIDYLEVTKKATFTSLEIQEKTHAGGQILLTPAAMLCNRVEELEDVYRCYFQTEGYDGEEIFNQFAIGDQAISQTFNEWGGHYYWRLVVGIGENYVDLSKTECDSESDTPNVGDKIIQLGNRSNEYRQNAIVIAAYGDGSPYIIQYKGINSFALSDDKIVTKLSSTENIFTGIVNVKAGSTGLENIGLDLNIGGQNMLRNSGFAGDYLSEPLADESVLNAADKLFNDPLVHWDTTDRTTVVEIPDFSASGYGVHLSGSSLNQTLYNGIISGESYVLSFKAKADFASEDGLDNINISCGGVSHSITATTEWSKYEIKFTANIGGKSFQIYGFDVTLCELQLERGTVATGWSMSLLDNSSDRTYYEALKHLDNALNASTTIGGGLVLTNTIQVGEYANDIMIEETGGMSGSYVDKNSVAFWAGGTLYDAMDTAKKYDTNTSTPQGEVSYVVTHGGKAVFNDAILRGAVYVDSPQVDGRVSIDDNGLTYYGKKDNGEEYIKASLGKGHDCSGASGAFYAKNAGQLCVNAALLGVGDETTNAGAFIGDVIIDGIAYVDEVNCERISSNQNVIEIDNSVRFNDFIYGFRPKLRTIVGNTTGETFNIDKQDYTIFVESSVGINLNLPSDAQDGQMFEIMMTNASETSVQHGIKTNSTFITIADPATSSERVSSIPVSAYGVVRLVYFAGIWYLYRLR